MFNCQKNQKELNKENIAKGKLIFNSVGCVNCHSFGDKKLYGPNLKYILGSKLTVLRDSTEVDIIIDKNYIKRSILTPNYEKQPNYKNSTMAKTTLTTLEVDLIVEFLVANGIN